MELIYFRGKGLCDVDVFSMGLTLVAREVFEKVPYPSPNPVWKTDADIEFCKLAREAGFALKQDFSVEWKHLLFAPSDGSSVRQEATSEMQSIQDSLRKRGIPQ